MIIIVGMTKLHHKYHRHHEDYHHFGTIISLVMDTFFKQFFSCKAKMSKHMTQLNAYQF